MIGLEEYRSIVLPGELEFLGHLAAQVKGVGCLHVNSTRVGGGVAEILQRLVPLMRELGVNARWEVMRGSEEFFSLTKAMHNTLQGSPGRLDRDDLKVWRRWRAVRARRQAREGEDRGRHR